MTAPTESQGVAIKVACPVCGQRLEYLHQESEAWGAVSLLDFGIVELTAHDRGTVIGPHMQAHHADGTWDKALLLRAQSMAMLAEKVRKNLEGHPGAS